jgi:hypothetical protein
MKPLSLEAYQPSECVVTDATISQGVKLFLDPEIIDYRLHSKVHEAFENGDVDSIFGCMPNHFCLWFFFMNRRAFIERAIYEEALVNAYTATRVNNCALPLSVLKSLFDDCDKDRLLKAGNPLPEGDKFVVYRGVSGVGRKRRARSYSWTLDYDRAKWFSERFSFLPNPAVYMATVKRKSVLCFIEGRNESEVITLPSWREMQQVYSLPTE